MFTGIIEETGVVEKIKSLGEGREITVSAIAVLKDINEGDSINLNGACQTVTRFSNKSFTVIAVEETIKKTNLGQLIKGEKVNLESSLTMNKKLGGHFVLGHVDTTGKILSIKKNPASYIVEVSYPKEFSKYIIHVGSICIEGISLTIAGFNDRFITLSIIPHTWSHTNLESKKNGSVVNLEFDVLGKYVAKILGKDTESKISEEWFRNLGY
jgi:riboflavin synthase